ncbi:MULTISPECIES: hypothetical protein [Pseudoalteromonas]|uniref:hypothetical protein n=1 Tax=Pseudoalteromonas TaxID=53246 RepID=UPI00041684ED|nr:MULTISPECIES: hypothetical protein [Pseudoalteromonas]TVU77229.1 hypothetical protein FQP81_03855 [Pseudoalteromonas elyakovii]
MTLKDDSKLEMEIHSIQFTGESAKTVSVDFKTRVKVINGASNTGKSFLVDSIDYMFGKESIDKIEQSKPYSEISLQLSVNSKKYTLFRGFPSQKLELYDGHIKNKKSDQHLLDYKVGTLKKGEVNLNEFFLPPWQQSNIKLAKNLSGEKVSLTIRLLSVIICSYEERIINKKSPIESGDSFEKTINRNLFNYLLTGVDYSSFKELIKKEVFDSEKSGRKSLLIELIDNLKVDIDVEYENESIKNLKEHQMKLEMSISKNKSSLIEAQLDVSGIINLKKQTSEELIEKNERLNSIKANLVNFEYLVGIYNSDIKRLESQEETAFLLSVNHNGHCGVCGNKSNNICSDLTELKQLKSASLAEIEKIKLNKIELDLTINSVKKQNKELILAVSDLNKTLEDLDAKISARTPDLQKYDFDNSLLTEQYSNHKRNIKQLEMIEDLQRRLQQCNSEKPPQKYKSPDFHPKNEVIDEFCEIYSDVLTEIKFPGNKIVTFDFKQYDVLIDGNPRHLNGKGVRAILHSVFKIATLLYCSRKGLFHPKLLILDSPLVTYRDPTESKYGELSKDEQELASTKLSYYFLNYLSEISHMAQFVIIENIDVPDIKSDKISVETFHGENSPSRRGLF